MHQDSARTWRVSLKLSSHKRGDCSHGLNITSIHGPQAFTPNTYHEAIHAGPQSITDTETRSERITFWEKPTPSCLPSAPRAHHDPQAFTHSTQTKQHRTSPKSPRHGSLIAGITHSADNLTVIRALNRAGRALGQCAYRRVVHILGPQDHEHSSPGMVPKSHRSSRIMASVAQQCRHL